MVGSIWIASSSSLIRWKCMFALQWLEKVNRRHIKCSCNSFPLRNGNIRLRINVGVDWIFRLSLSHWGWMGRCNIIAYILMWRIRMCIIWLWRIAYSRSGRIMIIIMLGCSWSWPWKMGKKKRLNRVYLLLVSKIISINSANKLFLKLKYNNNKTQMNHPKLRTLTLPLLANKYHRRQ